MLPDRILASNLVTAYIPRPDQFIFYGIRYAGEHIAAAVRSAGSDLRSLGLAARPGNVGAVVQRPGPVRPGTSSAPDRVPGVTLASQTVSPEMILRTEIYATTIKAAAHPKRVPSGPSYYETANQGTNRRLRLVDPFLAATLKSGPKHRDFRDVLPPSVLRSALLNRNGPPSEHGKVVTHSPNTLFDPLTGFCANVTLQEPAEGSRDPTEVIISFSGANSRKAWLRLGVRSIFNVLGLTPPKNFQQAAKLTRVMAAHIRRVNKDRMRKGLPLYKLTITGHSMGGAMATYAALRTPDPSVKAVTFNPLRLGLMARARIGYEAMAQAASKVTAVTVQGDWVTRLTTLHAAPICVSQYVPITDISNESVDRHEDFEHFVRAYGAKLPKQPAKT